jgi:hypothetical protein
MLATGTRSNNHDGNKRKRIMRTMEMQALARKAV